MSPWPLLQPPLCSLYCSPNHLLKLKSNFINTTPLLHPFHDLPLSLRTPSKPAPPFYSVSSNSSKLQGCSICCSVKPEALPSPQLHLTSLHQFLTPRITNHTTEEDLPESPYQHTPVFHTAHWMLYKEISKSTWKSRSKRMFILVHKKIEVHT